jgi:hypothetical protein
VRGGRRSGPSQPREEMVWFVVYAGSAVAVAVGRRREMWKGMGGALRGLSCWWCLLVEKG